MNIIYFIAFISMIVIDYFLFKEQQQRQMDQQQDSKVDRTCEQQQTRLKTLISTCTALSKWKKLASSSKNRYYRLKELIDTEEDYYKDLNTIQEKIKIPLVESKIISKGIAKQMFADLQNMMLLSKQIKHGLVQKLENWDCKKTLIGDYMARYSKFLLLYSGYFKNLTETQTRMKQLSLMNPQIRYLQQSLSTANKIVTIEDLMIKPLQRPLRYSLILKDYCAKLSQAHPDFIPVKNAISQFHKVNEQNNLQMEHKIKDHILIDLDTKFGSIIKSEARYYVTQYKAILIDAPIIMYLLSDIVIIVNETTNKEEMRIHLHKFSILTLPKNQKSFLNGLYLYGQKRCVYLRFQNQSLRDEVFFTLRQLIIQIRRNQFTRQKLLSERFTRNTIQQATNVSTIMEVQFVRPLVASVVGFEKRKVSQQRIDMRFVLQFKSSPKDNDDNYLPQQLSFMSWQALIQLQSFITRLYPNVLKVTLLSYLPKGLTEFLLESDQNLQFEVRSIFINLFLNSIFRSQTLLKRIDIICKKLDICDALWRHLGSPYSQLCFCNFCIQERYYKQFNDYENEINKRIEDKLAKDNLQLEINVLGKYCEIRTINSQQMIARLDPQKLSKATNVQRIAWVKARRGFINHTLTNIVPCGKNVKQIKLRIWFYSIKGRDYIELQVNLYSKIKQIVDRVGKILCYDLSDYTLEIQMGETTYLLSEDQILANVYHHQRQHENIISKFFSLFTADEFPQTFYLKKVWSLQPELQKACEIQKLIFYVEQAICRLKSEQLRIAEQQIYTLYGNYYAFTHYSQLDSLRLGQIQIKKDQFFFPLPPKYKDKKYLSIIYGKIKEIQQNRKLKKYNLLKNIMSIIESKPGWSCVLFKAKQRTKQGCFLTNVRLGCDIVGIQVRNQKKCGVKYVFKFQEVQWSHKVIGDVLIIKSAEKQYSFQGRDMWKVHQHFEFYQIYYRSFKHIQCLQNDLFDFPL